MTGLPVAQVAEVAEVAQVAEVADVLAERSVVGAVAAVVEQQLVRAGRGEPHPPKTTPLRE